jgi:hypothetical protein
MPSKERLEKWWGKQMDYRMTVGLLPIGKSGWNGILVHVYQMVDSIHVGTYYGLYDAKLAAWEHAQKDEEYETAPEIREFLLKIERELAVKIGQPNLTKRQIDVLGMMFDITKDAIAGQIWKVQK